MPDYPFYRWGRNGGVINRYARRLKEQYPDIEIIAVRPERWPGVEGLKPLGEPEDIVPKIFEVEYVDRWVDVTADETKNCCMKLAHHGYFVGQSSGAYLAACDKVMAELTEGTVTTLLCDLGERYFSAGLWNNDYSRHQ